MAKKNIYGLQSIKMGAKGAGGTMGAELVEISQTVPDSMTLSTEDNTETDFRVEEQDDPIMSIISEYGKKTLAWSSYDVSAANLYKFFGGTYKPYKTVATLGSVTGGASYVNGTYYDVALSGGSGTGARATVVVASGAVTTVTITEGGEGYTVGNTLTAANSNLGGAGSGFSVPVANLGNSSATLTTWEAPTSIPELEQSLKITAKNGVVVDIPRAKISPKFSLSFARTSLGQVDIVATVLTPEDTATLPIKITYPTS